MFVAVLLATAITFTGFSVPGAIPDTEDTWILDSWKPEKVTTLPSKHVAPDLTSDDLNKMWSESPKSNPTKAQKTGKADKLGGKFGKGAGLAVAGLTSLGFGIDIGDGIARTFGLPTTGSRACDFTRGVFGSNAGCSIASVPDYQPNTDIFDQYAPPGWDAVPAIHQPGGVTSNGYQSFSPSVTYINNVQLSADGKSVSFTVEQDVTCNVTAAMGVYTIDISKFRFTGNSTGGTLGPAGGLCSGYSKNMVITDNVAIGKMVIRPYESEHFPPQAVSVITWYAPTHPDRPEEMSQDPERMWQVTGMCTSGNPFNVQSAGFYESSPEWEPIPAIPCIPSAVTINQLIAGYETQTMATWQLPAEVEQWKHDNPDGSKELDLLRIGGITEPVSCFESRELCSPDWFLEMDKNTKYQCRYGNLPVALQECNVYRPTFKPAAIIQGQRYSDPDGKLPTPLPDTAPEPKTSERECFPSGWGLFNPAEWVLKPIKCAFVPRADVLTGQITGLRTALVNSPIGGLWSLVQPPTIPTGTTCGVVADVTVPNFGRVKIDTCEWSEWAPTVRNFLHWVVLAFGFFGIVFWMLRKVTKNQVSEVDH